MQKFSKLFFSLALLAVIFAPKITLAATSLVVDGFSANPSSGSVGDVINFNFVITNTDSAPAPHAWIYLDPGAALTYDATSLKLDGQSVSDGSFLTSSSGYSLGDLSTSTRVSFSLKVVATNKASIVLTVGDDNGSSSTTAMLNASGGTSGPSGTPGTSGPSGTPGTSGQNPANPNCKFDSSNPSSSATTLCNPLPYSDFLSFNVQTVKFIIGAVATLATVSIAQAGLVIVMAQGNEETLSAAKHRITWSIVGLVISLLAYSFVAIVLTGLKGGNPAGDVININGAGSSITK